MKWIAEWRCGIPDNPRSGTSCGIIDPPIIITELMSHNGAYYTIYRRAPWSLTKRLRLKCFQRSFGRCRRLSQNASLLEAKNKRQNLCCAAKQKMLRTKTENAAQQNIKWCAPTPTFDRQQKDRLLRTPKPIHITATEFLRLPHRAYWFTPHNLLACHNRPIGL